MLALDSRTETRSVRRVAGMGYRALNIGAAAVLAFTALSCSGDRRGPQVDLGDGLKLEMVWCPAGTFMVGSPPTETGRDDETQHQVTLTKGFWIGKYEVTQAQWGAVMGSNPSTFANAGRTAPVELVSWDDCQEFVRKVNARVPGGGFRLPTETEWEYACRAGTTTALNNGKELTSETGRCPNLDEVAWYRANGGMTAHPVGEKLANAWGLYDMHGNVWEWCEDWYGNYPSGSVSDPKGPGSGSDRVARGGGWDNSASKFGSALRRSYGPNYRGDCLGLRLARDAQ
ncbi:MAG: formylglycine-generating enzyme family protein [Lentisphaerae bacterium]|jgi:formylglycine-generating enzyme required for sulfatase activity|nr:formylglycine-generating enzyme family protein [Lentisphaerota bacterium]